MSLYCNLPAEKEKASHPGLYMKMQSPSFQGQKGRRKVSGRSMGHTLPGMLGTSQKGVPRCQTSLPELPIKYEIHERIPYCRIDFCFLLQLCGDFIPMLLNDSWSSVSFHGSLPLCGTQYAVRHGVSER